MAQLDVLEAVLRVLLALIPAALIGLDRELAQQPAGLRTHVLVGLGACLFTIAGVGVPGGDPTRIAAQVASGIGFLGAGAILRDQFRVTGLTTAASLWVTAAIGVAAGLGAYEVTVITTAIALLVLLPLKWVERRVFPPRPVRSFVVEVNPDQPLQAAIQAIESVLGQVTIRRVEPAPRGGHVLHGRAKEPSGAELVHLAGALSELPGIHRVEVFG
ncbi:MAG TPA: MgtC/SapB family protein [Actinomycetes bacterium]|nr:MgtC/SapB family protein [Actinomycetes bacterium]